MSLRPDQFATYVLFIELDPHQVDVNVHPAKHEVRFHQARLVHDFIYQALSDALAQSAHIDKPEVNASAFHYGDDAPAGQSDSSQSDLSVNDGVPQEVYQAVEQVPTYPGRADYQESRDEARSKVQEAQPQNAWVESKSAPKSNKPEHYGEPAPTKREVKAYQELLRTPEEQKHPLHIVPLEDEIHSPSTEEVEEKRVIESLGKAICIVSGRYLLMGDKLGAQVVSIARAEWLRTCGQLSVHDGNLKSQPLLVPLSIKLEPEIIESMERLEPLLSRFGITLKVRNKQALMVMGVPQPLRQQNLQQLIPDLLSYAASSLNNRPEMGAELLARWLSNQITQVKSDYTLSEAIQIIADIEQLWQGRLPLNDAEFVRSADLSATIAAFILDQ
jgi:DNA mismatch repair protein MutL